MIISFIPKSLERKAAMLLSMICLVVCGCAQFSEKHKCDNLGETFNIKYRQYLDGDNATGIRAMESMGETLQNAGVWLPMAARAHGFVMVHSRLFCLYENSGSNDVAKIHFQKCVYWSVISAEEAGLSSKEIARRIDAFDHDKCRKDVVAWDEKRRVETKTAQSSLGPAPKN